MNPSAVAVGVSKVEFRAAADATAEVAVLVADAELVALVAVTTTVI